MHNPTQDSPSDFTLLLNATRNAADLTSEEALPLIYDELRRIAGRQMLGERAGQTLQPTALVHEAWLRLRRRRTRLWNDRLHFFRVAVRTMRRILVDRARQRSCLKHPNPRHRMSLDDVNLTSAPLNDRVLLVDTALQELRKNDQESARVVELKFFGGFTTGEVAWMSGLSERTIERRWLYAKAKILTILQEAQR